MSNKTNSKVEEIEELVNVIYKSDIVRNIWMTMKSFNRGVKRDDVETIVDLLIDEIKTATLNGDSVRIKGFATFDTIPVPEKTVKSYLSNNELITIPAHDRLRIKPSGTWKKQVTKL